MGERKVLNKYFPADFDPRFIPRGSKPKGELVPVRMMLPFTIQCSSCSSFLYQGRKFNSKKEPVSGEKASYLTVQRFRFYIKCSVCSRPVTFMTDPENADYEMESGGTRNYQVWRDKEKVEAEIKEERSGEKDGDDAMAALEERVADSQREMEDLDNLDEIKAMNARHAKLMRARGRPSEAGGVAAVVDRANGAATDGDREDLTEHGTTAEEESLLGTIKFGAATAAASDDEEDDQAERDRRARNAAALGAESAPTSAASALLPGIKIAGVRRRRRDGADGREAKLRRAPTPKPTSPPDPPPPPPPSGGLGGLLGDYGSDSDLDF